MIYALHGIVVSKSDTTMGHRNLVQKDKLKSFILRNKDNIGTIEDVIKHKKSMAFTIDDGTKASLECAQLFANLNVPCIWFVNGKNIANDMPYSFAYLNEIMERCHDKILFCDKMIVFHDFHNKKRIRKEIKEFMHQYLCSEESRINFLRDLIIKNNITNFSVPMYAQQINMNDILDLKGTSVLIQNHLWEHNFTDIEDVESLKANITQGAEWLQNYFDYPIDKHALPYGLYSKNLKDCSANGIIFLLDNNYNAGKILSNVYNRQPLKL